MPVMCYKGSSHVLAGLVPGRRREGEARMDHHFAHSGTELVESRWSNRYGCDEGVDMDRMGAIRGGFIDPESKFLANMFSPDQIE